MGLKFNGFPVLDSDERLVGMITSSDMRFAPMNAMKLKDVMQPCPITGDAKTTLKKAYELMRKAKIGKLPLVDRQGRVIGLYSFTDVVRIIENSNAGYNCDEVPSARRGVRLGRQGRPLAHGEARGGGRRRRRRRLGPRPLEGHRGHDAPHREELPEGGRHRRQHCDGRGGSRPCEGGRARRQGRHRAGLDLHDARRLRRRHPQLTAVYNAAKALRGTNVAVIADGGVKLSGDVPKALRQAPTR